MEQTGCLCRHLLPYHWYHLHPFFILPFRNRVSCFMWRYGSEQVVVYPPSDKGVYEIWPDGNTLWNRINVAAEIIQW